MTTVQAASRRVLVSSQAGIATITLQDPRRCNALSSQLIQDILAGFASFERHRLRVIILRAAPGTAVWSAGHDVRELPRTRRDPLGWSDPPRVLIRRIEESRAPVIGLIEGSVWGGACEVALACDLPGSNAAATLRQTTVPLLLVRPVIGLRTGG
jgi:methylmalonyl-CoA decarboxylase